MIIADTCLVVHLFNETVHTRTAQKILEKDSHWILPTLWKEEYATVLSKLVRKKNRDVGEVLHHFDTTVDALQECETVVDIRAALQLSIEYKISVYDAHFVYLARKFDTLVVTEDLEMIKQCPLLAVSMRRFSEKA